MSLPLPLDFPPMEADTAKEIPSGAEWEYEPKWDGFRCLAFRDGNDVRLMSKSGQELERYFPEIVDAVRALPAKRFVTDGELIVTQKRTLDFDALLQRIHPAESRIKRLAAETPATYIIFDLLVNDHGNDISTDTLDERRTELEHFAGTCLAGQERIRLSPRTRNFAVAKEWFQRMAGPLDGVIAKRVDQPYDAGARHAMLKIKNLRTADCVIGGFRYGTKGKQVGSLLLGLYNEEGLLDHVGFCSGIAAAEKATLTKKLEDLREPPGFTGSKPGGPSRWSTERSTEWEPLAPKLVVEVQYDHFSGHRFRHGTKLLRWRPEKSPKSCTIAQVRRESESPLTLLD
ncbi:MAG TPA: ATP-dependent DNA ligase [Bryobacteraceae bacterium]|nr:ATP-dependent DNA ligase [Bryobacteraceae bacterium]